MHQIKQADGTKGEYSLLSLEQSLLMSQFTGEDPKRKFKFSNTLLILTL